MLYTKSIETNVRTMLNRSADQNPDTLNPGTIAPASMMIRALITKVNNPSVRILTGKVRAMMIGFINVLRSPRTIAVTKAEITPTRIPGKISAVMKIASAEISQFVSMVFFCIITHLLMRLLILLL